MIEPSYKSGYGGVRQYLHRMFPNGSTRAFDLAKCLKALVPMDPSVDYTTFYPLPACFPGPLSSTGRSFFGGQKKHGTLLIFYFKNLMFSFEGPILIKSYSKNNKGQEEDQRAFVVPLWLFGINNESSLREPTSLDVTSKLLQQFCCDGLVTSGEPILVRLEVGAVPKNKNIKVRYVFTSKNQSIYICSNIYIYGDLMYTLKVSKI